MGDLSMSPELRELLGDIADDPRAQLLRVKTAQAAREGLERNPKVSSSAPFLRKAERRLLELYREELGRILYAYAHIARMQVPENQGRVHFHDLKRSPPTRGDTDHAARAMLRSRGSDEPEIDLLRRCLNSTRDILPTEIVGATLRVTPSDRASVALSVDLSLEGSPNNGEETVCSFLKRGLGSSIDSYAWESLGLSAATSCEWGKAAAHYEAAVQSDPTRVIPALCWLRFSLLSVSKESALRASEFVDRSLHPSDPALLFMQGLGETGVGPKSSVDQRALARWVADRSGPISWKVIHAFN
jgi:hypothetical protein